MLRTVPPVRLAIKLLQLPKLFRQRHPRDELIYASLNRRPLALRVRCDSNRNQNKDQKGEPED